LDLWKFFSLNAKVLSVWVDTSFCGSSTARTSKNLAVHGERI